MSVMQGKVFEFEIFQKIHGGRLAAVVTLKAGADVAYILPDGTVQWTEYEDVYLDDTTALADIESMSEFVRKQNTERI